MSNDADKCGGAADAAAARKPGVFNSERAKAAAAARWAKKPVPPAQADPEETVYAAMRAVVNQSEEADRTLLQRESRAWLKENRRDFLLELARLERTQGKPAEVAVEESGLQASGYDPATDRGTQKALEYAEAWIRGQQEKLDEPAK